MIRLMILKTAMTIQIGKYNLLKLIYLVSYIVRIMIDIHYQKESVLAKYSLQNNKIVR